MIDRPPGALGAHHDIGGGETRRQLGQRHMMGLIALGDQRRAAGRGMGHGQPAEARAAKLLDHQLAHLARADQQPPRPGQIAMELAGQAHHHGGDGDRLLGEAGFAAHPLGRGIGRLQRLIELAAHQPGRLGAGDGPP